MKNNWEYKTIGDVCFITDYVSNGSFASLRENVQYIDTKDYAILVRLADYTNCFDKNKFVYINKESYDFLAKSSLKPGDIIMSNVGSLGKLFICPDLGQPMSIAPNSILIRTDNNKYYYYYFQSSYFQGEIKKISSTTALPKFNKTQFKKIDIKIPPLSTQQSIVSELDSLSKIIADCKETLKDYDALEQSIFYDMFGDPVKNEKGWEVKKVIDVVTMQRGFDLPSSNRNSSGHIPVYGSNGILGMHNESKLSEGIITGRSGSIGEVYVSFKPFWPLNTTLFSKDTHGNNLTYLQFLLRNFNLKRFAEGAGVPTLNRNNFHNENIIAPPLPLQLQFASKIEAIEQMKAETRDALQEAETLFQARMDYWFN